jgi:hypothetical protein
MSKGKTKSPIRVKPLRQAGQSLGEQWDRLVNEKAMPWIAASVFAVILALHEWWRWWTERPPSPITITVFVVLFLVLACWRVRKIIAAARSINRGIEGEKVIGECLDRLRSDGYHTFHDILGDGFNVDHVLIGPGGVFAIETKTRTKPAGRESEVVYDGEKITVDGFDPERDPVAQVKAVARQVKDIIRQTTEQDVFVQPVILFPGWYTRQPSGSDIWVLNETAFPKWIRGADVKLDAGAAQQIAGAIAAHVRAVGSPK